VVLPIANLDPSRGIPRGDRRASAALHAFLCPAPFLPPPYVTRPTGVPEVGCPNAGAEIVVARAGVALDFETIVGGDLGAHQDEKPRTYYFAVAKAKLARFTCKMW
jgi:hypothetical protein